jgi:hypothetical protein
VSLSYPQARKALAALVFAEDDDPNRVVEDFAKDLERRGHRIGGMIQVADAADDCDCRDTHLVDVETGRHISILQDLGRHSQSCRVDTSALANVGHLIAGAITRSPELLFVNRFGKLEAEGKGVLSEIGAAVAADIPTLVSVGARYLDQWRLFAMGLDEELSCSNAALEQWWSDIKALRALGV